MHTRTQPALLWRSDVQSQLNQLYARLSACERNYREALKALEHVCEQRDEARLDAQGARADADYWMKLARSEAERADQAQPLTKGESRAWTLAGMLALVGAGVVLGLRMGGTL